MPSARTVSRQPTQERIVCAAVEVFSEYGYHAGSLRIIARRAEVNEVTLFRYFPKKVDLFMAAIKDAARQIKFPEHVRRRFTATEQPSEVLRLLFDFLRDKAISNPEILRLLSFAALESKLSASLLRASLRSDFDALSEYLTSCMERGAIRALAPDLLAESLLMTAMSQLAYAVSVGEDLGNEKWQLAAMCNSVSLEGLLPASAEDIWQQ